MFSHRRRRALLPDLRFEGYGIVRGVGPSRRRIHNIRAAWSEAEIFVMRELRMGTHPDVLERDINAEVLMSDRTRYRYQCLCCARRILTNMRNARQFDGLPTFAQLEQIRMLRPGRASYEMMMYDRFRSFDVVTRYGGDFDTAREIARARSLDREVEDELRRMREADTARLEQQYRANSEILLAELQATRVRAEVAETRLQLEQQQQQMQMGGMPAAWYTQAPPAAALYAAGAPRPQPYYVPGMNAGYQGEYYPGNQMPDAAREGFQPQPPYQPNQYQQRYDGYQQQNPRPGSEYTSSVYSGDPYDCRRY